MKTHGTRIGIERETCILFNEAEPGAIVTSASPVFIRRMRRQGREPEADWPGHSPGFNERFLIPKDLISIRRARQRGRPLSAAHLEKLKAASARSRARFDVKPPIQPEPAK